MGLPPDCQEGEDYDVRCISGNGCYGPGRVIILLPARGADQGDLVMEARRGVVELF